MKRTLTALTLIAGLIALAGCAATEGTTTVARMATGPDVVDHRGLADVRFGDSREQLERDHGLVQTEADCAPRLPERPAASPVFDDGRLVLLWADLPLHTPEGVAVGSPVDAVRAAYPGADALTAPPESYQYDGLLVTSGERAYLFLHDQQQVQKVIVGYAEHARLLFHEGFGTC